MTYLFSSTLDYGYDLPFQPPATMMSLHGWTATWRCETEKFYLLVVAFVELFYHRNRNETRMLLLAFSHESAILSNFKIKTKEIQIQKAYTTRQNVPSGHPLWKPSSLSLFIFTMMMFLKIT